MRKAEAARREGGRSRFAHGSPEYVTPFFFFFFFFFVFFLLLLLHLLLTSKFLSELHHDADRSYPSNVVTLHLVIYAGYICGYTENLTAVYESEKGSS
jgi:hypothetical protein